MASAIKVCLGSSAVVPVRPWSSTLRRFQAEVVIIASVELPPHRLSGTNETVTTNDSRIYSSLINAAVTFPCKTSPWFAAAEVCRGDL